MIEQWIASYQPQSEEDTFNALREIMQELALAGLSRGGFFEQAAFYGGTALRIFYGLERFSEDLDFSLLQSNPHFSLEPYFPFILEEFEAVGLNVSIKGKEKKVKTSIESAFLKSETLWKELVLESVVAQMGILSNRTLKIKIEVDKRPPLDFGVEEKLLLRPYSFYVKCFTLSSLFAGKVHALLFRKWKNRVKGRDWYDMEWYIRRGVALDVHHFCSRALDTGDWNKATITSDEIIKLLHKKINTVSFEKIKTDVLPFIKDTNVLDIWSPDYFKDLVGKMKFER